MIASDWALHLCAHTREVRRAMVVTTAPGNASSLRLWIMAATSFAQEHARAAEGTRCDAAPAAATFQKTGSQLFKRKGRSLSTRLRHPAATRARSLLAPEQFPSAALGMGHRRACAPHVHARTEGPRSDWARCRSSGRGSFLVPRGRGRRPRAPPRAEHASPAPAMAHGPCA